MAKKTEEAKPEEVKPEEAKPEEAKPDAVPEGLAVPVQALRGEIALGKTVIEHCHGDVEASRKAAADKS